MYAFAVVVTDPRQTDNPVIFASSEFYALTGYTAEEVLGRNCRFLQGHETERRHLAQLRSATREEQPCSVCLLNYKKNGEKFWNQLYMEPIFEKGRVVRYVGIMKDVTQLVDADTEGDVEMEDIVEEEEKKAGIIGRRLSEEGQISWLPGDACSLLPSSLVVALDRIQQSFVLVDPHLPGMPIIHAAEGFIKLTGYPRDEIIGQNCRFLQGPGTDMTEVAKIRKAIEAEPPQSISVTLLNYKHDGSPFWNALHISPVRDADGYVAYFVGVQLNLNDPIDHPALSSNMTKHRQEKCIPYCGRLRFQQQIQQDGTVGAVRMAIRSISSNVCGLRRQPIPH